MDTNDFLKDRKPVNGEDEVFKIYIDFKIQELDKELKQKEEERDSLNSQQNQSIALILPKRKFRFLSRIFRYREYSRYNDEFKKALEKESNRLDEIRNGLKDIDTDINSIKREIDNLKYATSFENLNVDMEKAIAYLIENQAGIKFKSCTQALELAPNIFGKNKEFMERAIDEDYTLIKFDQTDEIELYNKALELVKNTENNIHREDIENLQRELYQPKKVPDGKYKIPRKYILQGIRNEIETMITGSALSITVYDGVLNEDFGKQIQKLYEEPDTLLGMHNFCDNSNKEIKILSEGLLEAQKEENKRQKLCSTVAYPGSPDRNLSFIEALSYIGVSGYGLNHKVAVLKFPKNVLDKKQPIPIWGSQNKQQGPNYVLPKYIYGIIKVNEKDEPRIEINNHDREEQQYKYLKYDRLLGNEMPVIDTTNEIPR